ncbi:MAG TPA: RNA polymerase sigma factor [Solirubrobacterales bacterium]
MYATNPEQRYAYLQRIARRHGGPGVDPDEAVQEAFASFLAAFDPDGEAPPLAWLTLTLKRRCWALRDRRHAHSLGATPTGIGVPDEPEWRQARYAVDPADVAARLDDRDRLAAAMPRLRPDERRALSLLALGHTYREIGELTGWTYTKVNRCLAEGRTALRADEAWSEAP